MPTYAAALFLLLLSLSLRPLSSSTTPQPRRILHQPLLPENPSPPPAPSPPEYPFTATSPESDGSSPFFQSYPYPPPPPAPASFASFPANISSLTVSAPSKPNSTSSKLIIAAVASVVAAITVVSLAVFLHLRHRTTSRRSSSFDQSKPPNSDTSSVVSFNQPPSRHHIPKLQRPSQSSAEFLYLGTLVNSHAPAPAPGNAAANPRKLDSPELRPLPPLNTQRQNLGNNAEVISSKDDESEEFYSPKGSVTGKDSSIGAGSASRRSFPAVETENFNGSASNSSSTCTSSLPGSGSPTLSPTNNQTTINSTPDLIEIPTVAPLPEAQGAESASPSPLSSSSPERHSTRSDEISPRDSSVPDQNSESPARINSPVHPDNTSNPGPPETRVLEVQASPSPQTSSSPESSPRSSNASDRNVESVARSSSAPKLELHNTNDISTSLELLEFATRLALSLSRRSSDVSDQNLESPVRDNSFSEHTVPTPPEIRGLKIPESGQPLPSGSVSPERCSSKSAESSPRNSDVSDQFAESPARSNSPVHNNSAVAPPPPAETASTSFLNFNVWNWNVKSPVRSSSPEQMNASEMPTATEVRSESALPLSPENCSSRSEESSPRNSDVSDHLESPVGTISPEQRNSTAVPTATEMETLLLPKSASPGLYSSSEESSPWNSNISDQNVEPLVGIISPTMNNFDVITASPEKEASVLPESAPPLTPAKSEESSPRNSNVSDPIVESQVGISSHNSEEIPAVQEMEALMLPESAPPPPPESPASQNHPEVNEDTSPRISNASNQDDEFPAEQDFESSSPHVGSPVTISSAELHKLPPPSPTTPSSLERHDRESEDSLSTTLNKFDQNIPVFLPSHPPPFSIPPPPPPPPPQRLSPKTPTPAAEDSLHPPTLINQLKPIGFEASTLISPMQLPSENEEDESNPKPKLKPLHWDKVRASSDREMVWDQLKCSSFKLNEEMIETLFVVNTPKPNPNEATKWQVLPPPGLDNGDKVLDPKKSQNIAILLKALHVTVDEVCEGLLEGNAEILGAELLESLLKMAPSKEEERKLREYRDDSPVKLGAAERFLKAVLDIPHAFRRVEALLYASNFESEVDYLKKSFATLEASCEELRTSRMFLKLLEAVLKTGNRMNVGTNRGDAHAFKLDTLLKLVDVKGADGKTTLLHFVVQEMIRSEGARLSGVVEDCSTNGDAKCRKVGLQVVASLGSELSNVKKAAVMDAEVLSTYVTKLAKGITNVKEILELNRAASMDESSKFAEFLNSFSKNAEEEICRIQAQESLALSLVKEITEYFHGNSAMEEPHPFRIFMVVRDFLTVLDRVCKEVGMINERTIISSAHRFPVPVNPMLQQGTGALHRPQHASSDDETLPLNGEV